MNFLIAKNLSFTEKIETFMAEISVNKSRHKKLVNDTLSLALSQLITTCPSGLSIVDNLEIYPNNLSDLNIITVSLQCAGAVQKNNKANILLLLV